MFSKGVFFIISGYFYPMFYQMFPHDLRNGETKLKNNVTKNFLILFIFNYINNIDISRKNSIIYNKKGELIVLQISYFLISSI